MNEAIDDGTINNSARVSLLTIVTKSLCTGYDSLNRCQFQRPDCFYALPSGETVRTLCNKGFVKDGLYR